MVTRELRSYGHPYSISHGYVWSPEGIPFRKFRVCYGSYGHSVRWFTDQKNGDVPVRYATLPSWIVLDSRKTWTWITWDRKNLKTHGNPMENHIKPMKSHEILWKKLYLMAILPLSLHVFPNKKRPRPQPWRLCREAAVAWCKPRAASPGGALKSGYHGDSHRKTMGKTMGKPWENGDFMVMNP